MYSVVSVVCDIWKVLFVIYGKLAKVAIRQRSFLPKLCSGRGAGRGPPTADT